MRAALFANGVLEYLDAAIEAARSSDMILAANGGAHHLTRLNLTPTAVIGDFDSLSQEQLDSFRADGVRLVNHPTRKDFTDLELAIHFAVDAGADDILILGALGARWDQTLANVLLPASLELAPIRIRIIDGPQEILALRGGEILVVHGNPGDTLSLVSLTEKSEGITTEGLEYPLHQGTLKRGETRGISNVFTSYEAQIELGEGLLLCIVIHQE